MVVFGVGVRLLLALWKFYMKGRCLTFVDFMWYLLGHVYICLMNP